VNDVDTELRNMGVQRWRKEIGIEQTGHLTHGQPRLNIKSSHAKEKEEEDDDDAFN
jgi:hypothetical protein